ncbi:hypothetical protein T4C_12174 [Trichinella pseudospiralis]|uniref:Uncharacterized protein n=1 Tax=Trichinella pseudospiralis TaxID=6337 RepID=A0A0V1JTK3_TRIPS|nr:hypothetical protein T4C_12174 [Trichinella pseudospiralis]
MIRQNATVRRMCRGGGLCFALSAYVFSVGKFPTEQVKRQHNADAEASNKSSASSTPQAR